MGTGIIYKLDYLSDISEIKETNYYEGLSSEKKLIIDLLIDENCKITDLPKQIGVSLSGYYLWLRKDPEFKDVINYITLVRNKSGPIIPPLFRGVPQDDAERDRRSRVCRSLRRDFTGFNIFGINYENMERTEQMIGTPLCYISYCDPDEANETLKKLYTHGWVPVTLAIPQDPNNGNEMDIFSDELTSTDLNCPSKLMLVLGGCSVAYFGPGWKERSKSRAEYEYCIKYNIEVFMGRDDIRHFQQ